MEANPSPSTDASVDSINILMGSLGVSAFGAKTRTGDGGHDDNRPFPLVKIQTLDELKALVTTWDTIGIQTFAVDAEGLDLGREGPLTVLSVKPISAALGSDQDPAFVIDMLVMGAKEAFAVLGPMLENKHIQKWMFDCRSDSDAMYHQSNVKLCGVRDLQVMDQGCRIRRGEQPPQRNGTYLPFIKGMRAIAPQYVSGRELSELTGGAPHKSDENVWGKRPLAKESWQYAANDVHLIELIGRSMEKRNIGEVLLARVMLHSVRYEGWFRDREEMVVQRSRKDKNVIMEEISILKPA